MSTIGSKIDEIYNLREKKRELEKQIANIEKEFHLIEIDLMDQMDKECVDKSSGKLASVSIIESIKPNVVDWEVFYKYIYRHKAFFLLERRPSVTACREAFETKGKLPGVVPFTKRVINLRTRD